MFLLYFNDKEIRLDRPPGRLITAGYILALFLIAALALTSHMIITKAVARQQDTAEMVFTATQLRILSQSIPYSAMQYEALHRPNDLEAMRNGMFNFENGLQVLTRKLASATPGGNTQDLNDLFFKPPNNLEAQAQEFILAGKRYGDWKPVRDPDDVRTKSLAEITQLGLGPLLDNLGRALYICQSSTINELNMLNHVQEVITWAILIVLFLEAGLIFAPLVTYISKYSNLLLDLALKDSLTGLDNRRAFIDQMGAKIARFERHGEPFCVVMADIDKFKLVNDTYGHAVGDKVIQLFGNLTKKTLRAGDMISRIGGEEFAFVLQHATAEQGMQSIERLRRTVETTPCVYRTDDGREGQLTFTASFGVVSVTEECGSVDDLLGKADKALYRAKTEGRNRVILDDSEVALAPPVEKI